MKVRFLSFLVLAGTVLSSNLACNDDPVVPDPGPRPPTEIKNPSDNPISDLVLIYDGGLHRQSWTKESLRPYIYRETAGKAEFLFDGFLFLEIFDSKKNIEYYPGYKKNPAPKADWLSLLDTYFSDAKSLGALETVLEELATKGERPIRKRQVVISIPTPINGFTGWGSLDGKTLDFNKLDDQVAAEKWFIDEALKRWTEKNYKHLDLTGFYWVDEDAGHYQDAMKLTSQYVRSRRRKFYWIPYWTAQGGDKWKELGFDYAYEQPNYFFNTAISYCRLNDACAFGEKYGLGMEMEFDQRVSQPEFKTRFDDYIKAFTENKIWKLKPVAYYEGGGAWGSMAASTDGELKKMYQTLGDIIVERQRKADERLKK